MQRKIHHSTQTMAKAKFEMNTEGWVPDPRPCFFKTIHPDQCKEYLRIPPHFMKHLKNDTSNRATLKCSSGRFWNIELRPAIGSMYLQDGWQQFLKDNSLGNREFLLFTYDGNMCFDVQIFEKSGCERIDMSVIEKHQEFVVPKVKKRKDRPRKNSLDLPPLKSCGDCSGQSHLQLHPEKFEKVKGKGILKKINGEGKIDMSFLKVDSEMKKSKDAKNFPWKTRKGLPLPILKKNSHTRSCSLEVLPPVEQDLVCESFSSSFPYFQICLKRSSVEESFIQHIPVSFSRAHLEKIKTRMALRNQQGETWEVNCIPSRGKHNLSGGWVAFAHGNNLKVGDICIFELVGENEFQVNIFRM